MAVAIIAGNFDLTTNPHPTIQFDSKFQIIAQLFDSIKNEKKTIRTALAKTGHPCVRDVTTYHSCRTGHTWMLSYCE